jgi:hypothetical protein
MNPGIDVFPSFITRQTRPNFEIVGSTAGQSGWLAQKNSAIFPGTMTTIGKP